MNLEEQIMELIVNAGQAKSYAQIAMAAARKKQFAIAEQNIASAKEVINLAHKVQTQLIAMDEGQGKIPVTLLMVHAQDHLMNAMLAMDMAEEIIILRKELA